jgi:hypothetical protein
LSFRKFEAHHQVRGNKIKTFITLEVMPHNISAEQTTLSGGAAQLSDPICSLDSIQQA